MTMADRIVGYLTLIAQVNIEDRPFVIFRKKGHPITQKIPLATFADLKEALFLMQFSNGVRPYILEWYFDVFLPTYNEKQNRGRVERYDVENTKKATNQNREVTTPLCNHISTLRYDYTAKPSRGVVENYFALLQSKLANLPKEKQNKTKRKKG
jgi:hypothetical protein